MLGSRRKPAKGRIPVATDTRDRILDASGALFQRQGFTGTGIKQILADAHAPFSSLYHFFPGGKDELGAESIRLSGEMYRQLVLAVFDAAPDLLTGIHDCFAGAAETLRVTDYADACPIATVALEVASINEPLRLATAEVFASWITVATSRYESAGITEPVARELAIAMIALLEGAFVLSRAARSTEPMEAAGKAAVTAARVALDAKVSEPRKHD
jgi:AcrR family transcriptional regulator